MILGAVAGWLAGLIMKTKSSLLVNLIVGIVGGILGGFIFGNTLSFLGSVGPFLTSVLGAVILLFIVKIVRK